MACRPLLIALAASLAVVPLCVTAQSRFAFKSVTVDLPPGDEMFPNGPDVDAANGNCLACHSADMVLNQPALPKARWQAVVDKMRTSYRAPIDPKDVDPIVDYLAATKGAK